MKIKSHVIFNEEYIPPRCRKPRFREAACETTVTLREVTEEEAPISMRVTDYHRYLGICTIDLRRYKNKLYRLSYNHDHYCGATYDEMCQPYPVESLIERIAKARPFYYVGDDKHAQIKALRDFIKRYLVINGQVWEVTGEPMYEVCTFGLGHNHGETALMIAESYNPNVSKTRYFPANKRAEAIAEGLRIAAARGDTNSFENIRNCIGNIEVVDGIVTRDPVKQHGNGDNFLNMIEGITEAAGSAAEGEILACVAALSGKE